MFPPRIGGVAISRRRPGESCRDLELYQMSGAPPHPQGCNWLQLNIDNRNAFDNPVLRIIFPRSLASCRFMDLYPWLWRNSAHREQSKLSWRLAELTGGTRNHQNGMSVPRHEWGTIWEGSCSSDHGRPYVLRSRISGCWNTTRLKTTICRDRFTVRSFDNDSTKTVSSRQTTAFPHSTYSFALSPFPCARFGSSYSRIGIRLWGG